MQGEDLSDPTLFDELRRMTPLERIRELDQALASFVAVRDGFATPEDIVRMQRWGTLEEQTRRF
jgi:hypothetical protein